MKKKGFTLVELLAVIAILAILVIIALPNVLEMYRQARQNSFENEVKEIFRQAQQQYLLDSLDSTFSGKIYASDGTTDNDKLKIQGGNGITYCVSVNTKGEITDLKVSNGSYYYDSNGSTVADAKDIDESTPVENSGNNSYGNDDCQDPAEVQSGD